MGVFKKNDEWWIDFYDENDLRKRKKVGRSKKVAQDTLAEVKTLIRQRKMGIAQKPVQKKIALSDFFNDCEEYFDTNQSAKTAKRYKTALWHFSRFMRNYPRVKFLGQIEPSQFEKYKTYRKLLAQTL